MQSQFFKHHKLILKLHGKGKNSQDTSEEQDRGHVFPDYQDYFNAI